MNTTTTEQLVTGLAHAIDVPEGLRVTYRGREYTNRGIRPRWYDVVILAPVEGGETERVGLRTLVTVTVPRTLLDDSYDEEVA